MNKLIIILIALVTGLVNAQSNYDKGMQNAFELWRENPTEASNLFERIATAEPDNWLPAYYAAQINIQQGFSIKDETKLASVLNKAQEHIDKASEVSQDNPELLVLQAQLHTAWVAFDGAKYGMLLSGKIASLYGKAKELAPENPRVHLSKVEWDMGSARFFGQDTQPFCKDIEKALELFVNFKPETPYHPNWGKERAEQVLKSCKQ